MSIIRIEATLDQASLKKPIPSTAFAAGDVYRVEFPVGLSLYKVTQSGAVTASRTLPPGRTGFVTPWWFSYESATARGPGQTAIRVKGIADIVERTRASAARSLQDYLRARGAVCLDWNRMTHLLIVELRRSAVGLIGTCSGQPMIDDGIVAQASRVENVRFIGGEQQLYIPGLRAGDVTVRSFGPLP